MTLTNFISYITQGKNIYDRKFYCTTKIYIKNADQGTRVSLEGDPPDY